MKKKILLSFLVLTCTFSAFRFANEEFIDNLLNKLEAYLQDYPQQKVYLHTDRSYYASGDTLWFSSYVLGAIGHTSDSLTKVLYVDLTDRRLGKVVAQRIIEIDNGTGRGDIALPDTLAVGTYHLRAYTQWMRNSPDDLFFEKEISIYKPNSTVSYDQNKLQKLGEVSDCQFFPEGGDLVTGIESRVGFKIVNMLGQGLECEGIVIEDKKDTVALFATEHAGMGYFSFTPNDGKTYQAFVKQADGVFKPFEFPTALAKGYFLQVDNLSNKDNIKVYVSHNQVAADAFVSLVVHQRGETVWASKASAAKRNINFIIPRNKIPEDGVVVVTLFDPTGQPRCERLLFEKKNDWLNVKLNMSKPSYQPREKMELDLAVTDAKGQAVKGSFSVAITDANQVKQSAFRSDILSYMLLQSDCQERVNKTAYFADVKGAIEDPAAYFDKENLQASTHLDILMMTQGWRRFTWQAVQEAKKNNPQFLIENGFEITGKVLKSNGKPTEKPVKLTLLVKDKNGPQFNMVESQTDGTFGFYQLNFYDSTSVMLQGKKDQGGRNLDISLNKQKDLPKIRLWQPKYNPLTYSQLDLNAFLKMTKEMQDFEKGLLLNKMQMLQEVKIKGKKGGPDDERDTRKMYGSADKSLKIDDITCVGAFHPLQLLQGRMAGVSITANGTTYTAQIRGAATMTGGAVEPLYLVDGVIVDKDFLVGIQPCDIEAVDVLTGATAAIFGSQAYGGAISFLTKQGNKNYDWSKDVLPGTSMLKLMGYASPRDFYHPKYDTKPTINHSDLRSTLYWNPKIETDQNGKASVSFWASDARTTLDIRVEGINKTGKMGVGKATGVIK